MDYSKLGFKCGLEIHQQLDTGKLFCACPSVLRRDAPDFKIKRKLRAIAGETGEIDPAVAHAQAKGLSYIYEGYDSTTCLLEIDECPPEQINSEALKTALTVAILLNCEIPNYVQIMRKTVIDGSNTSAFQRTLMIASNGYIEVNGKRISIAFVGLEEDAARRTGESKQTVIYRLDRLGIPLIEVATGPDISSPEQAKEVALAIGRLLRATGKAMRGIGTIRQDVNVSIKGHPRIELKGFQELKQMPETIRREVQRQQQELKNNPKPHVRNVKPDFSSKFLRPMPGAARMYPETDLPMIEVNGKDLYQLKKNLPELPDKKLRRLVRTGLNEELANQVLFDSQFERLHKKFSKIDAKLIATTLLSTQKEAKKKANQEFGEFSQEHFEKIFSLVEKSRIAKEAIPDILLEVAQGEKVADAANKFKLLSDAELKREISKLKREYNKVPEDKLKGIIIGRLRGRADVQKIMKFLN